MKANLKDLFKYHTLGHNQIGRVNKIREAALAFANVVSYNTIKCSDQSAAIRHIRDAMMTANAAISLEEPFDTAYFEMLERATSGQ